MEIFFVGRMGERNPDTPALPLRNVLDPSKEPSRPLARSDAHKSTGGRHGYQSRHRSFCRYSLVPVHGVGRRSELLTAHPFLPN
jgi:hypothetical protein